MSLKNFHHFLKVYVRGKLYMQAENLDHKNPGFSKIFLDFHKEIFYYLCESKWLINGRIRNEKKKTRIFVLKVSLL